MLKKGALVPLYSSGLEGSDIARLWSLAGATGLLVINTGQQSFAHSKPGEIAYLTTQVAACVQDTSTLAPCWVLDNPLTRSVTADMRNSVMKELTASRIVRRNQVDEMTTQDRVESKT
jgi:hypothetical protein